MLETPDPPRAWLLALLVPALSACYPDAGQPTRDDPNPGGSPKGEGPGEADAGETGGGEGRLEIMSVELIENPHNHLSFILEVEVTHDATVVVDLDNGFGHTVTADSQASSMAHAIDVLGLRSVYLYDITVTATDGDGSIATDASRAYRTDRLPADLPAPRLLVSEPGEMAPGFTLFNLGRWNPGPDPGYGYLVAVDEIGEVVWYCGIPGVQDARQLESGNLLVVEDHDIVREIDLMGRELAMWSAGGLTPPEDSFHHEVAPDGDHLLVLGSELRTIDGYDDGMGGSVTYDVVGDVIVEFDRAGMVVDRWQLLNVLEPWQRRVLDGFHNPFWDTVYMDRAPNGAKDWSHGNAVIYDGDNDLLITSLRHQDWIVAIDRGSGDLAWRLGPDGDFTLEGDGEWFYHQHAPELQANGGLLLYDNGNLRPGTGFAMGDVPPYSRVVQLELDTADFTARQTWEFVHDDPFNFAPFVGDADRLSNDNVLMNDGGLVLQPWLSLIDPTNLKFARIREVTPGGRVVFEIEIGDPFVGYTVYRAERIESLRTLR